MGLARHHTVKALYLTEVERLIKVTNYGSAIVKQGTLSVPDRPGSTLRPPPIANRTQGRSCSPRSAPRVLKPDCRVDSEELPECYVEPSRQGW